MKSSLVEKIFSLNVLCSFIGFIPFPFQKGESFKSEF